MLNYRYEDREKYVQKYGDEGRGSEFWLIGVVVFSDHYEIEE